MDNTNQLEGMFLKLRESMMGELNPKFDDLSSKIQDLEEGVNEALEALNERRYLGDSKEYFEE